MAGQQPVSRRKALETIGVATAAVGLPTAGAATAGDESSPETEQSPSEAEVGTELTGFYTGTVDRIVDGDHVVILVETDERVIDQYVVPAEEYPSLEERDAVYLFILFGTVIAIWEVPGE
jgi:endonuclease YncB( thermonuclease family)